MAQRPDNFDLNPMAPLARGLVFAGLGRFHGNTRYHDSSLHRNTGTLTGYTGAGDTPAEKWQFIPQLGRWALGFDGSNDYISASRAIAIPFTISVWIKLNSVATAFLLSLNEVGSMLRQYYLGTASTDGATWVFSERRDPVGFTDAVGPASTTAWTHILGIASATNARSIYVNGVWYNTSTTNLTAVSITTLDLGRLGDDTPSYCAGRTADPCLWSRVLSPAEIIRLADPSNVMLDGLIRGAASRNRVFVPAALTGNRRRRLLICGSAT